MINLYFISVRATFFKENENERKLAGPIDRQQQSNTPPPLLRKGGIKMTHHNYFIVIQIVKTADTRIS